MAAHDHDGVELKRERTVLVELRSTGSEPQPNPVDSDFHLVAC
jgi:hypothetical protein